MTRPALEIAHGALLDLESAKRALRHLETLLSLASTSKDNPEHSRNLVEIAWDLAADAANTASYNYEQLGLALEKSAPQNAEVSNRGADSEVSQ